MKRAIIWLATIAGGLAAAAAAPAQVATAPPEIGPIAALQQQLRQAGLRPGPVNGVMTEQTRAALAVYERRHRRPPEALGQRGMDPVRRVQAGLQRLGMFDGPPDGVVGPATRDAIIRFEASHQIPVDPRVSDRLIAELDKAVGGGGAPPSRPAAPPQAAAPPSAPPQTAAAPPQGAAAPPNAPPAGGPEALGRRALPPGVNPPPIR